MDDYPDAAERHLDDAELLFAQVPQRLANASHLFGMVAECSLKTIARAISPSVSFSGSSGRMPALFTELTTVASPVGSNPDLVKKISAIQPFFAQWKVAQRYANQTAFSTQAVTSQQAGAKQAILLMRNFLQGGVI